MHGLSIITRTLSQPGNIRNQDGVSWQYHPRSDHHSKVLCWSFLFDLLLNCYTLQKHVEEGRIGFGVNHQMRDFKQNKAKDLDLIVCSPGSKADRWKSSSKGSFADLASQYRLALSGEEERLLKSLPEFKTVPVGGVLLALEAKAAMTAHVKACPRLYDELNSSHTIVHGDTSDAIAIGLVLVNISATFVSPLVTGNQAGGAHPKITSHRQPEDTQKVIAQIEKLPRRSSTKGDGFDGIAQIVVECRNDGSPVRMWPKDPSPAPDSQFAYSNLVSRAAHLYSLRFPQL